MIKIFVLATCLIISINSYSQYKSDFSYCKHYYEIKNDTIFFSNSDKFLLKENIYHGDTILFTINEKCYDNDSLISICYNLNEVGWIKYEYYKNGNIKSISSILNGVYVGEYCEFYINKRIKVKGSYDILNCFDEYENICLVEEQKDTLSFEYYLEAKCQKIPVKIDHWLYWDIDGKLIKEENWKNGKLIDSIIGKNPYSKGHYELKTDTFQCNDVVYDSYIPEDIYIEDNRLYTINHKYYKNDTLVQVVYPSSIRCSGFDLRYDYYINGNVKSIKTLMNDYVDFGRCVSFHPNKRIKERGIYNKQNCYGMNRKRNCFAMYLEFGKSGEYEEIITYEKDNDSTTFETNIFILSEKIPYKDGVWQYWEKDGKLIKEEKWDDGKLIIRQIYKF